MFMSCLREFVDPSHRYACEMPPVLVASQEETTAEGPEMTSSQEMILGWGAVLGLLIGAFIALDHYRQWKERLTWGRVLSEELEKW